MIKIEQTTERLSLFEDSLVVAAGVAQAASTYWNKEAEVHITGMWKLCKEMSAHITMLQEEVIELEMDLDELRYKLAQYDEDEDEDDDDD